MKKIIALVLCVVMLLTCAAALAETAPAEKESMGVLRVNKAFDIRYKALDNGYKINIYQQNDMAIIANISTPDKTLPGIGLIIIFDDSWADTERLNDISQEDMDAVKASFYEEYETLEFETRETSQGTELLIVKVPSGQDAYVYTIYKGHEIELHLTPGEEQEALTDADIDRVADFLGEMEFVPVEE